MCAYCACAVHVQTHFTTLGLWWLRLRCFPNPCESDNWWLTTARRNSYQPVLVRIFLTVPSWRRGFLSRHVENVYTTYGICILRTSLSGWRFLFMIYANCGAIAVITSTTYMTIMELFDEFSAPFSPEVIRSLIMTPTSILNDIILSMEIERSAKACCWGE